MLTFKRFVANLIEKLSGNLVIPPHELHLAPERVFLRRFFAHFDVDCVFDVGANAGQYARMLRDVVGFQGPIISFEPVPELVAELEKSAKSDPLWFIQPVALDREAGPALFNVMVKNQFSSLHPPSSDQPAIFNQGNAISRKVPVIRSTVAAELPRWQAQLGFNRPFLKMDTQGNDLAVIKGAGAAIEAFVGLQSELALRRLYEGAANYAETIAAYQALGFELSALVPNNAGHFPLLVEIDCVMFNKAAKAPPFLSDR